MSEQPPKSRSLSEISHLFLNDLRQRQTGGAQMPRRRPPGQHVDNPDQADQPAKAERPKTYKNLDAKVEPAVEQPAAQQHSIDMTPEEFAAGQGYQPKPPAPLQAVIAPHLNEEQVQRTIALGRHLARDGERVGLIIVDSDEFRLFIFDNEPEPEPAPPATNSFNAREITQALEELHCDVDRWLVLPCNPRLPQARTLLHNTDGWILLSRTDHDGVVSAYRSVKGLADEHQHPELSVALIDVVDNQQGQRVFHKLSGVCRQFLNWPIRFETAIDQEADVAEHVLIHFHGGTDKAQLAAGEVWLTTGKWMQNVMANREQPTEEASLQVDAAERVEQSESEAEQQAFRIESEAETPPADSPQTEAPPEEQGDTGGRRHMGDVVLPRTTDQPATAKQLNAEPEPESAGIPMPCQPVTEASAKVATAPEPSPEPEAPKVAMQLHQEHPVDQSVEEEVIELQGEGTPEEILDAVLKLNATLAECGVRPPACPQARLTVSRDRRLTLLAVADSGLSDLAKIGAAVQWLEENRQLIAMAMPQLSIDKHLSAGVHLYIDHNDANAEALQRLMGTTHVTLHTWRRLRWGEKRALLLEAA